MKPYKVPSMLGLECFLAGYGKPIDGKIVLTGCFSRKTLTLQKNGKIKVFNHIDDSTCAIEDTNIPEAIEKGAFFLVDE